jgi:hypothetical protein
MSTHAQLESIAKGLGAASSLTEGKFLEIGQKLESSIDTLAALNETFERLHHELESENVRQAAQDIRQAATQVVDLATAHATEKEAVGRIGTLTANVGSGVNAIANAVKNADLLAVSARIAAANLGDAGDDFSEFADEIARTLKLAKGTLERFRQELDATVQHLGAAKAGQAALDRDQSQSMQAIPQRLSQSIDAIAEGSRRAASAAAAVQEKSRQVSQRIASAVAALQIGDKTRQRIEHAEFAVAILREIVSPGSGDWAPLDDTARAELVALGCRLQAAQMTDTAEDFDRQVRQTLAALSELGGDAREILRLGNATYGGGEAARGAFLLELKDDVSHANVLLEAFQAARSGIDGVITAVSESGASLVRHISMVRSLEADIRIMGLNATLKCGRLGNRGRALSVVAQELRVYANQIEAQAGGVMTDLEHVVGAAGSLSGRGDAKGREEIAALAEGMKDAVRRLGAAGQSLADALGSLERDSSGVATILDEAVQRMSVREEIGRALTRAAADLSALAPDSRSQGAEIGPVARRFLDMLARSHTMVEERVVHDTVVRDFFPHVADLPRTADTAPPPPAAVDDMLF